MKKLLKYKIIIFIAVPLILIAGLAFYIMQQNTVLQITEIEYINENFPERFDELVVCHISDLHNAEFGAEQQELLDAVYSGSPDIIVITGDLIDRRNYDLDTSMEFINSAIRIAPIFYVSGNHEAWSGKYDEIKKTLTEASVVVLDNESITISTGIDDYIDILGLSDPGFTTEENSDEYSTVDIETLLEEWSESDNFKILLSHRPELFDIYVENNIDMVFSGHAHGGQAILPIIGPLYAPNQGFFPDYTEGMYTEENTSMVISRGLGNSIIPIRVFNNPEILFVTMKNK